MFYLIMRTSIAMINADILSTNDTGLIRYLPSISSSNALSNSANATMHRKKTSTIFILVNSIDTCISMALVLSFCGHLVEVLDCQ